MQTESGQLLLETPPALHEHYYAQALGLDALGINAGKKVHYNLTYAEIAAAEDAKVSP